MNQLLVTLSSFIGDAGQVGVSFLTILAHHAAVVVGVLPKEALWVVVAVDVDLGQGVVGSRLLATFMNTSLQPGQQQLQSGERHTVRISQQRCKVWRENLLTCDLIRLGCDSAIPSSYRFLFSTSATSSSVENCPLTTMIRFLITSSAQSTSSNPPMTTGRRLGFTWKKVMMKLLNSQRQMCNNSLF